MAYNLQEPNSRLYSLCELRSHLDQDLLLECTTTIQVDISIERLHQLVKGEDGHMRLCLGDGYLVSLGLPAEHTLQAAHTFADGERQLVCDLRYADRDDSSMSIEDVVRALGLKVNEQMWRVKTAP